MRKILLIPLLVLSITSCSVLHKAPLEETTLITIDDEPTIADEFLYVYEKNNFNNDSIYSEKDVDEYFDLFIKFKLKVKAAKSEGMDTTNSFKTEFESYKDQLIKPYLSEAKEQERLVEEAYNRMKFEVDASHILINISPDASPADTSAAYQKIKLIYKEAISGKNFEELAAKYSEDPSAKTNLGRLGYFTTFQMVFAFENAAYNTPTDSISEIFRSRFGYHILKVHDIRPASGKVKVSHIMLRASKNQADSISVRNKIFEIYDQILGGADWNELCQRYSEDQRTKNSGGTLPFIGLKQINDAAFEKVAFGLKAPGEISDPVKSNFGWHIIKLEEKQGLEPFEDIKSELTKKVSSGDRSILSQQAVVNKLKQQNNFQKYQIPIEQIIQCADSSLLEGNWSPVLSDFILNDTIFSIGVNYYISRDLTEYIKEEQRKRSGISDSIYMTELINQYIEKSLLDYEEDQLLENDRDFRMLLNEYYEGILLFEIMNELVWEKAIKDTIGLDEYFAEHQDAYYWTERADAAIISSKNHSVINDVKESLNSGAIRVYNVEFDTNEEIEALNSISLDTMVLLFKKYENSSIKINLTNESISSKLYQDIRQYFDDLNLPKNSIIVTIAESLGNKILLELNSESKKSLEFLYNKESTLTLYVTENLFEKGDNEIIDSLSWEIGIVEFSKGNDYYLVEIDSILEKEAKDLDDIKGSVISDYQTYLEKNWLESLYKEYTVVINKTALDKIKKSYNKKYNSPD